MDVFSGPPHSSKSPLVRQHAPSPMRVGKASAHYLKPSFTDVLSGPPHSSGSTLVSQHAPFTMRAGQASAPSRRQRSWTSSPGRRN